VLIMNKKHPFFSIITVNLNSGGDIMPTLDSIKKQKFRDFEHLIIDGGSSDISNDILLQNLRYFEYFSQKKDKGIYDAINKGIKNSKGKYIILLHSGDTLKNSNSLQELSKFILNNPSNDVYLSNVKIYSSINPGGYRIYPCSVFHPSRMRYGIMPPHPAIIIKREMYGKLGFYSTKYIIAGDFDFVVRLFQIKDISWVCCDKTFITMIDGGLSDRLLSKKLLQMELLQICRSRNLQTNHFLLLFRFLIKFPGLIPKVSALRSFFV
jgi:glycosyltransferase involved in cell wall biosynthesis